MGAEKWLADGLQQMLVEGTVPKLTGWRSHATSGTPNQKWLARAFGYVGGALFPKHFGEDDREDGRALLAAGLRQEAERGLGGAEQYSATYDALRLHGQCGALDVAGRVGDKDLEEALMTNVASYLWIAQLFSDGIRFAIPGPRCKVKNSQALALCDRALAGDDVKPKKGNRQTFAAASLSRYLATRDGGVLGPRLKKLAMPITLLLGKGWYAAFIPDMESYDTPQPAVIAYTAHGGDAYARPPEHAAYPKGAVTTRILTNRERDAIAVHMTYAKHRPDGEIVEFDEIYPLPSNDYTVNVIGAG